MIVNAQYSQTQEIEADKFGLHLLNEYYHHVAGATDFFTKLQSEKKINDNIAFLYSHPLPQKSTPSPNRCLSEMFSHFFFSFS